MTALPPWRNVAVLILAIGASAAILYACVGNLPAAFAGAVLCAAGAIMQ